MNNAFIRKAIETNTIVAYEAVAQILGISQDDLLGAIVLCELDKKRIIFRAIERRKDDIPKSTSYEKFLSDALDMPEENILLQIGEILELFKTAIRDGKDVFGIVEDGLLAEKILKNIEIQVKRGNIEILGEWRGFETEILMPIEEILALFDDTCGTIATKEPNFENSIPARHSLEKQKERAIAITEHEIKTTANANLKEVLEVGLMSITGKNRGLDKIAKILNTPKSTAKWSEPRRRKYIEYMIREHDLDVTLFMPQANKKCDKSG